jgi:stress response protein YsnF
LDFKVALIQSCWGSAPDKAAHNASRRSADVTLFASEPRTIDYRSDRISIMSSAINHEMGDRTSSDQTVPMHAEEISVSRQQVSGDTVQVSTITRDEERLVDEQLTHERIEVERVPIGRPVDAVPPVREEGDTTVMSVVEEIIVIKRRLILKEEVRIRRVRMTEHHRETMLVRKQDAVITRTEAGLPAVKDDPRPLGTDPTPLAQEQQR